MTVRTFVSSGAAIALSWAAMLVSCDSAPSMDEVNRQYQDTSKQVGKLYTSAEKSVSSVDAIEEIRKLQTYEYQVVPLPISDGPELLTQKLAALGKERWDCEAVERVNEKELYAFCIRRPFTPLRLLPSDWIAEIAKMYDR